MMLLRNWMKSCCCDTAAVADIPTANTISALTVRSLHCVFLLPTPRTLLGTRRGMRGTLCTERIRMHGNGNARQCLATHGHARTRTATHARQVTAFHGNARFSCYRTVHSTGERQCTAISRLTRLSTAKHGKARQSTVKQRICSKALLQRCSARHVDTLWKRCYSRHGMRGNTRQLTATTCYSRRRHQQQHNAPSHSHDTVMI